MTYMITIKCLKKYSDINFWLCCLPHEGKKSHKVLEFTYHVLDNTYHILDDLVLAILSLDLQQVVAEIKEVEAPLLAQKHDDGAASPV